MLQAAAAVNPHTRCLHVLVLNSWGRQHTATQTATGLRCAAEGGQGIGMSLLDRSGRLSTSSSEVSCRVGDVFGQGLGLSCGDRRTDASGAYNPWVPGQTSGCATDLETAVCTW